MMVMNDGDEIDGDHDGGGDNDHDDDMNNQIRSCIYSIYLSSNAPTRREMIDFLKTI